MLRCIVIPLGSILLISGCNSRDRNRQAESNFPAHGTTHPGQYGFNPDIVRRGLPGDPRTLDPELADDEFSFQVVRDLYEGLTAEDSHGNIVPGAANSWTVDRTGTIYTFHLRPNARWSDGTRLTASQFVNGLRRAVDPRTASGSAELLEVIKGAESIIAKRLDPESLGVTALNDDVVRIELARPAPYILQILSQPVAAPLRHMDDSRSVKNVDSKITDGAYVLDKRVYGSYIKLRRNPFYWDSSDVKIPNVMYLISEPESTELNEYLAGQLEMTYTIPIPDLDRLRRARPSEVQLVPILATFYLALNMNKPVFNTNPGLRQALSMSIDRNLIAEKVMPGVLPAFSFVPPGVKDYAPPLYQWATWPRTKRIEYARALLSKSGYSPTHPLNVNIYFNNDQTVRRVILAIADSWKENLNVSVTLLSDEFRVFLVRRKERGHWDIARFGWNADYDDAASFLDVFSGDSPQNDVGYRSAKFNALISSARSQSDIERRRKSLESAESVLLNDYVAVPIYFYEARRLVKPFVGGATITPLNHAYSKFLYWKPAPK